MRMATAILLLVALVTSGLRNLAFAQSEPPNEVRADFQTIWMHDAAGDTFAQGQKLVAGRKEWHANLQNLLHATGETVTALRLTLDTDPLAPAFDHLGWEYLITQGPPSYGWSFGSLPVGAGARGWVGFVTPSLFPVTFTTGFDACRSADITQFSEPGIQTLTITVTPREEMPGFALGVQAEEDSWVNPVITHVSASLPNGEAFNYEISPDGHSLSMWQHDLAVVGTPYTYTVTIAVTPSVPTVDFLPFADVSRSEMLASGTATGNSVSHPVGEAADDVGTWTWSAGEVGASYPWYWTENRYRAVSFTSYSRQGASAVIADSWARIKASLGE